MILLQAYIFFLSETLCRGVTIYVNVQNLWGLFNLRVPGPSLFTQMWGASFVHMLFFKYFISTNYIQHERANIEKGDERKGPSGLRSQVLIAPYTVLDCLS
jgi:hypothetical protein